MEHNQIKKMAAIALCLSFLGGAAGTGTVLATNQTLNKYAGITTNESSTLQETKESEGTKVVIQNSDSKPAVVETKVNSNTKLSASEVYSKNVNSTVGITTEITTNYFGYTTQGAASGSGFIISEDGYIVTNYHVIEDANSVKVTLYNNKSYDAEIIGSDESSDLAVLKIDAAGLTPVVLGNSNEMSVGDDVVAIGNPLGELTFTLTSGIVSALDRAITTENSTMVNLIQTDCAINSGNSGGALFNMYGEVIGITNAKYSSNSAMEASIDNIGFAIPIDTIKTTITSIIENGYAVKPYIGVSLSEVSTDLIEYGVPQGAKVKSVTESSPAEEAGIKANDIIIKADDKEIKTSTDLIAFIKSKSKDDKVELTVYRQGKEEKLTITIGETKTSDTEKEKDENDQYEDYYGNDYDFFDDFDFPFGF